jgi:hypothetical protein
MPLLDHFRPPVSERHGWESFHGAWANSIMAALNRTLPRRYIAEFHIHLGQDVEADVAEFDQGFAPEAEGADASGNGGVAVQTKPYSPPAVAMSLPAVFPDDIEVRVIDRGLGRLLVAVIELVSPSNKHGPGTRRGFAAKCAAYLQRGVGLVILDVVSDMYFNLHDEFVQLLGAGERYIMIPGSHTYSTSYRPARRKDENQIDVWTFPLTVGQPLPVVPLALRATTTVPLDLESTYAEARRNSRLD